MKSIEVKETDEKIVDFVNRMLVVCNNLPYFLRVIGFSLASIIVPDGDDISFSISADLTADIADMCVKIYLVKEKQLIANFYPFREKSKIFINSNIIKLTDEMEKKINLMFDIKFSSEAVYFISFPD